MKKSIDNYSFPKTRKVIKHGNSLGVTIPSEFVKDLGLKNGDELAVCLNKEASALLLIKRPFELKHKDYDMNFKLTLPKELVEKYIKNQDH